MTGNQLKNLREEYDITQERLAHYMKVPLQVYMDWENDKRLPDEEQMKRLYELFSLPSEPDETEEKQRIKQGNDQKDTKKKKSRKARKGKKRRRKSKHKTKVKTQKQTVEKKRRIWPLLFFLVLLVSVVTVGGVYVYHKYGDEYILTKKDSYKVEDMSGTFTAEDAHDGSAPSFILRSDLTFTFTVNDCEAMHTYTGSWNMDKKTISLTSNEGTIFTFNINSMNQLTYTSDTIGCGPYHKDIFNRGSIVQNPVDTTKGEERPQTSITSGTWTGDHNTLSISSVEESHITFALTSTNPEGNQTASITDISGRVSGNTVTFEFQDDGYGNAGSGTLVFDGTQAVFSITKSEVNPEAVWSIRDSGVLTKE